MFFAAFCLVTLVVIWAACARPKWFWVAFLSCPILLGLAALSVGFDPNAIPIGPINARVSDPSALGLLIGILYHSRRQQFRSVYRHPAGATLLILSSFLILKIMSAAVFGHAAIDSNEVSNKLGVGVVAAIGEVRDSFIPLLAPLYAILSTRHLKLKDLAVPLGVLMAVILLKAGIYITLTGQFWTSDAQFRFINSDEALILTMVGFLLPFLPSSRLGRIGLRWLGGIAFGVALLANHRSQWLGALVGGLVCVALVAAGKLRLSTDHSVKTLFLTGIALALCVGCATVVYSLAELGEPSDSTAEIGELSDSPGIGQRLLAITDPERDPTASWREDLWKSRIEQVGDDWLFGRQLGDRRPSFVGETWVTAPNHNAYVTAFELGGLFLLSLVLAFWGATVWSAVKVTRLTSLTYQSWPAALSLIITSTSLAYGIAYDFPRFGPALATMLTLLSASQSAAHPTRGAAIPRTQSCTAQQVTRPVHK